MVDVLTDIQSDDVEFWECLPQAEVYRHVSYTTDLKRPEVASI